MEHGSQSTTPVLVLSIILVVMFVITAVMISVTSRYSNIDGVYVLVIDNLPVTDSQQNVTNLMIINSCKNKLMLTSVHPKAFVPIGTKIETVEGGVIQWTAEPTVPTSPPQANMQQWYKVLTASSPGNYGYLGVQNDGSIVLYQPDANGTFTLAGTMTRQAPV